VSLGVGSFIGQTDDKGWIFLIGAVSLALSALVWRGVRQDAEPGIAVPAARGSH